MVPLCSKWHVLPVKRENNAGFKISGILGVCVTSRDVTCEKWSLFFYLRCKNYRRRALSLYAQDNVSSCKNMRSRESKNKSAPALFLDANMKIKTWNNKCERLYFLFLKINCIKTNIYYYEECDINDNNYLASCI